MNPKANGQIQTEWGWLIATYLFLGGVGAGAYCIGAFNILATGTVDLASQIALWISWPALIIGSVCLLADLGQPSKAILAGMRPGTSWIARGTWIITIFMILAFVHTMLYLAGTRVETALVHVVAILGMIFAVGTMAYTGILLGASKGIPFWRSGVVPVLFVVSALVTGHFTITLGLVLLGGGATAESAGPLRMMAVEGAGMVVFEVLAIFFFLQAAFRTPDPAESASRILRHRAFVIGYILLGLAAPLILMLLVANRAPSAAPDGTSLALAGIGSLLGLVGGLLLRYCVLICGTMPTWNIAGFEFRRIARPKEPRPEIGLLPPQ
jgi:formate-dependent nitrite reductase membrane component NrfD